MPDQMWGLTIRLMTMVVLHLQVLKVSRIAALATRATPTAPRPAQYSTVL